MVMITLVLLHSAAASLQQDLHAGPSPYVLDYITKLNSDCTSAHCVDQLDSCSDGTDADCQKRLTCIRDSGLEDAGECLKSMKWSQLDDTEVKLLDCAHSNKCLPSEAWTASQASSFAEILAKEKEGRGLAEEEGKTAAEQAAEQAALEVVAAHLVHLEKTEEMVKQTQGLMDEVLKDKTMSLKEKIEDLHMLTDHLSFLQESAKKAMQGMGLDTSDFDTEEQDEEEEEDHLEEKIHEDEGTEEAEGKPEKAAKADASKPSGKKPEATAAKKPEATAAKKPESTKPEAAAAKKPESTKPEATAKKPESKKPEATTAKQPESKKPEATAAKKPESKNPEATAKKPESKKPEAKAANAPGKPIAEEPKKAEKGETSKTKEGKSLAEMHMRTMEDE